MLSRIWYWYCVNRFLHSNVRNWTDRWYHWYHRSTISCMICRLVLVGVDFVSECNFLKISFSYDNDFFNMLCISKWCTQNGIKNAPPRPNKYLQRHLWLWILFFVFRPALMKLSRNWWTQWRKLWGEENCEVVIVPISGFQGDNMVDKSTNIPWYKVCTTHISVCYLLFGRPNINLNFLRWYNLLHVIFLRDGRCTEKMTKEVPSLWKGSLCWKLWMPSNTQNVPWTNRYVYLCKMITRLVVCVIFWAQPITG